MRVYKELGVNVVDVLFIHTKISEETLQKDSKTQGSLRIRYDRMRTTIDSTFRLTDQSSRKEVTFLVRGLHIHRRWNLCIGVARGIATNREYVSCHTAIPGRTKYWQPRELHLSRVGRIVVNRAQLLANEDYYECRI